mmetsp:Transcript_8720/g.20693  ORF Transcript_8720/g.20693 Transcript_8720/m.20693 type:complete len:308 (+) Transcript_8720:209-1132(+)
MSWTGGTRHGDLVCGGRLSRNIRDVDDLTMEEASNGDQDRGCPTVHASIRQICLNGNLVRPRLAATSGGRQRSPRNRRQRRQGQRLAALVREQDVVAVDVLLIDHTFHFRWSKGNHTANQARSVVVIDERFHMANIRGDAARQSWLLLALRRLPTEQGRPTYVSWSTTKGAWLFIFDVTSRNCFRSRAVAVRLRPFHHVVRICVTCRADHLRRSAAEWRPAPQAAEAARLNSITAEEIVSARRRIGRRLAGLQTKAAFQQQGCPACLLVYHATSEDATYEAVSATPPKLRLFISWWYLRRDFTSQLA